MMKLAFSILCAIAAGIGLWGGCLSAVEVEQALSVFAVGMAIDVRTETLISFNDARSAFPGDGRRLALATLHRWRLNGKLDTIKVAGVRYTSAEAIERMVERENAPETPAPVITASQRQHQSEAAQAALKKMGVSGGVSRTIARPTKDVCATTGMANQ